MINRALHYFKPTLASILTSAVKGNNKSSISLVKILKLKTQKCRPKLHEQKQYL